MKLHSQCLLASAFAVALVAAPVPAQQSAEIDNVAAFARLYGVARWFYPSDAAATLDWNRFAIDGVRRVRVARTPAELENTLKQLFTPLGPGIEIGATLPPKRASGGARNPDLIAWHYRGPGITEGIPGPYSAKRTNRSMTVAQTQPNAPSVMAQSIPATALRGKAVRLRARMRIPNPSAPGWAGLWLRVDRSSQAMGFFDNMSDRPVRDTAWREYVIEGKIDADAVNIVFGALSAGSMPVDVDAIELAVREAGGDWTPLPILDASFESKGSSPWMESSAAVFTRPAVGAADGAQFVRIAPPRAPLQTSTRAALPSDSLETPVPGAQAQFALARGLQARVPLSLTDAEARTESPALAVLRTELASTPAPAGRNDADARLADAIVAWNVFRHFYPYWGDLDVDWDARLRPQLEIALNAPTARDAHLDAVRAVVADLNDGHGSARDVVTPPRLAALPLQFRILANQLVVSASRDGAVPVGSVVTAIDGTPAATRVAKETRLASGTPQWKRTRAEGALQLCQLNTTITLTIEPPTGATRDAKLPCAPATTRAVETRPDSIAELQPGIWYVDLTRIRAAQLTPKLEVLAKAHGVIFDMRGYPTDAGAMVLPYLMRAAEDSTDRWMHVPRFAQPFGVVAAWQDLTWHLQAATPQIAGQRIFLTDGRAISYAESVMGYVRDYKLGTIIGGTTAGANGNVAGFSVPGGFSIAFTGMRVTRHDGKTAYHTAGVSPDIPLEPTLAGIRAGSDELLLRALQTLRIVP